MDSGKLNNWLQIAANLGLLIGLLLVVVQLEQNAQLLKTQLLYEESQRQIELETKVVGEEGARVWAKSLLSPADLSLEEQRIMEALLWSYVEQLRAARMLSELGLLSDAEWRTRVDGESAFFLGNPYARAWWETFSDSNATLPAEVIDAVNERLVAVPANFTLDYTNEIMKRLPE